jgi:3-dehydroquinate synthase
MNTTILKTPLGNSEIIIEENGLGIVNNWIKEKHPTSKALIITDTDIGEIYKDKLIEFFSEDRILSIKPGDGSKNLAAVNQLAIELLKMGFTRYDVIIGFGGGMITDLAGFVASIYMRGVPLILIPTSFVGMVDAAIGGKTALNLEAKNILGTFYPAELVLIDPYFVHSMSDRHISTGIAEVIKCAATLDKSLVEDLEQEEVDLETIITKSVNAKVSIVNKDMMESGLRKVLNFGHTFGHAIEQASEYRLMHGEAVSIGMVIANKIAQKLGKQKPETGKKIEDLLKKFKLPCEMPTGFKVEDLVELIKRDKKKHDGKISFIIAPEMGKFEMIDFTPEELVKLAK